MAVIIWDFEFYQAQYLGSGDNLEISYIQICRPLPKYLIIPELVGSRKIQKLICSRFFRLLVSFKDDRCCGSQIITIPKINGRLVFRVVMGEDFWIAPLNRILLTFTYCNTKEDNLPLVV
jgi:hypothetical protein